MQVLNLFPLLPPAPSLLPKLLLTLLQRALAFPAFASLQLVHNHIADSLSSEQLLPKIKEKASVHRRDSNQENRAYFLMAPLLLTRAQV